MEHFSIDEDQYLELKEAAREMLISNRLLGASFRTMPQRDRLVSCVRNNLHMFPLLLSSGDEKLWAVTATAQMVPATFSSIRHPFLSSIRIGVPIK